MLLEKLKQLIKSSDEVRVIRDPMTRLRQQAVLVLVFVIAIFASFYFGAYWSSDAPNERDALKVENKKLQQKLAQEKVRSAALRLENESVNKAVNEVRETNSTLREQISDLESDVTYYQRVMNPIRNDKGLRIDSVDIEKTVDERRFWLNMVLTQLGKQNRSPVKGTVAINFEGSENGVKKVYSINDIKLDKSEPEIIFRFRYYQEISEEFVLPENFLVEKYDVVAHATGSKAMRVSKEEQWPFNIPLEQ